MPVVLKKRAIRVSAFITRQVAGYHLECSDASSAHQYQTRYTCIWELSEAINGIVL